MTYRKELLEGTVGIERDANLDVECGSDKELPPVMQDKDEGLNSAVRGQQQLWGIDQGRSPQG
ncbi:hypothetical protein ACFYVK_39740 [Streptomyces chartreusis]|uniref:hypothetical protein n=1 Tax=Streptomyces chartreusis TaxID=1969 RepID=UPI00367C95E6